MPDYLVHLGPKGTTLIVIVHLSDGCGDARRYGNAASPECKPWWQPLGELASTQLAVEHAPDQFRIPNGVAVEACQNCPN
jgi:hypothetical protein